jgi:3-hydroxyacyl-CoA dehydrogenase/enoyl-CoA hydratase/3-hydroxybutyryl-CoA epimerase/3-hydroxyacyl-CoA dehydrogenase/enoyl-CoA hydratase/3-hydroxybutyryl-CoA epimerase/enoyl-CoA isomerase
LFGRLGQKSGVGFFRYTGGRLKGEPDPTLADIVGPLMREPKNVPAEQVRDRLFLPMLVEATRVLEEGIVRNPRDVDLGLIYGIGFPPFQGGLLFWADRVGAAEIVQRLKTLEELGPRAEPTDMLLEMASKGSTFYK